MTLINGSAFRDSPSCSIRETRAGANAVLIGVPRYRARAFNRTMTRYVANVFVWTLCGMIADTRARWRAREPPPLVVIDVAHVVPHQVIGVGATSSIQTLTHWTPPSKNAGPCELFGAFVPAVPPSAVCHARLLLWQIEFGGHTSPGDQGVAC